MPPFDKLVTKTDYVPGAIIVRRQAGGPPPRFPIPPTPPAVITVDSALGCTVDGNGADIEVGAQGTIYIKDEQTIVRASMVLLPGITGSIVIDVWVVPVASYSIVNSTYSICGTAKPTISAAQDSIDSLLMGWATLIPADSFVVFNVDSSVTPDVKWANLVLDSVLS